MNRRIVIAGVVLLGQLAALTLAGDIATLFLQVPRSPNEGWNAYHAAHAMAGAGLYPLPPSLLFNNYPPLSYFVIAPLGLLLGDQIVAGRMISLLAALGIAGALFAAARRLNATRIEAALAAAIFLASPWVLTKLAGMDDPQLLGHLLDALGLLLVLQRRTPAIVLAALLFAAAMFVKLLYVDLPLAVLVWLWLRDRKAALVLAGSTLAFGVGGIVLSNALLHIDLLHHVLSARVFVPGQMFAHPGQWLVSGALPLLASLSLLKRRGDDGAQLAGLYAAIALPLTLFFSGGEGVSAGPTVELAMAAALGSAVFINRNGVKPLWGGIAMALMALVAGVSLLGGWSSYPSAFQMFAQRGAAHAAIARIAAKPDPVLCEMLALCYWAGRAPQVDAFGLGEAFKRHTRDEGELIGPLNARRFSLVQITRHSSFAYSPVILDALARNYHLVHADSQGSFYEPRQ